MNTPLAPPQPTGYDTRRWLALSVLLLAAVMDLTDISIGSPGVPAGTHGYWKREWHGQTIWETGWFILPEFLCRGIATKATVAATQRAWADVLGRPIHAFPSVAVEL